MNDLTQYRADVHKIANEVEWLITNNHTARTVFTDHIDWLCKMAEDYGQAQQPYTKKLEKTKDRIERDKNPKRFVGIPLTDICPPPKGYVEMNYLDNYFINVPVGTIYRPAEPINPLLWFGIFGDASLQRKPEENESLMCYYVLLAIIHDVELKQPTDRPLFSDKYEGKWFQRNKFCEDVWAYYHYPNQASSFLYHSATPQEKLLQLNRVFERVQADLASGEKTGKAGDATQPTPETEPENKNTIKEQDETLPKRLQEFRWFLRKENWRKHWKLILSMIICLLFVAAFSWFVVPYINNRIRPDDNPKIQAPRMPQTPHRSSVRPAVNQTELGPLKVWKPQLEGVNTPANYKKTSPSSQTKISDPNRNSP